MNICQVGAELLHADGQKNKQTNMMKLLVPFCNFANTPKNRKMVFLSEQPKSCQKWMF